MTERIAVFSPADLPPALAADLPPALRAAAVLFFVGRVDSPAVQAAFDAVPEPDRFSPAELQDGMALAARLGHALAASPTFEAEVLQAPPADGPRGIRWGFHAGDPEAVGALLRQAADPQPLHRYLDEVPLVRVRVGGRAPEQVVTTHPPQPGRPLGGGWFRLARDAGHLRTPGGGAPVVPGVRALDLPAPPEPPDPLTEDDVLGRIHHHLLWSPVRRGAQACWLLAESGQTTVVTCEDHRVVTAWTRPQGPWIGAAPLPLARLDALCRATRAAWAAFGPHDPMRELVLDAALLRAPALQSEADFAGVVLDLGATAAALGPVEVPCRVPAAAGLPAGALAKAWRWLPEVAHRYTLVPSRAHLVGQPGAVVSALAALWVAGPPGFVHALEPRLFRRGLKALRAHLGRAPVDALLAAARAGGGVHPAGR